MERAIALPTSPSNTNYPIESNRTLNNGEGDRSNNQSKAPKRYWVSSVSSSERWAIALWIVERAIALPPRPRTRPYREQSHFEQ